MVTVTAQHCTSDTTDYTPYSSDSIAGLGPPFEFQVPICDPHTDSLTGGYLYQRVPCRGSGTQALTRFGLPRWLPLSQLASGHGHSESLVQVVASVSPRASAQSSNRLSRLAEFHQNCSIGPGRLLKNHPTRTIILEGKTFEAAQRDSYSLEA